MMRLNEFERQEWWRKTWDERGNALKAFLGETERPGIVTSFRWPKDEVLLPGACAMRFAVSRVDGHRLDLSLGLSQPIAPDRTARTWEFGVYSDKRGKWQVQLLFDLVTHFVAEREQIDPGYWLPLVFFEDSKGSLSCGLTDKPTKPPVGAMRGLYLWPDYASPAFKVSTGSFKIMVAVTVTAEEDQLAQETTPPHLLLLLRKLGVGLTSSPHRSSVTTWADADQHWASIRRLTHNDAVRALNQPL